MRCRFCHNPDTWDTHSDGKTDQWMTAEEVLERALRYRSYWRGKGGITASGGEPLLQMDFLTALFELAKREGVNTALDTSAQPFSRDVDYLRRFDRLMAATDLVLLDIKHVDPERHRWETGHDNDNILDCARYLSDTGKPVWIRHVLVPGISSQDDYLIRLRRFLDTLTNVQRVDVLPYHTLGSFKWKELGIPYTLSDVEPPTEEMLAHARSILQAGG